MTKRRAGRFPRWVFAGAAAAVLCAPLAVDWFAYGYAFRRLLGTADSAAYRHFLKRVSPDTPIPFRYTPSPYPLLIQYPPRSGRYAGKRSAFRVSIRRPWRSPVFGLRRDIIATATVVLVPSDRPGEARMITVE
jgi:hypothetical protein